MDCAWGTCFGVGSGKFAPGARTPVGHAFPHCLAALIGALLWATPLCAEPAFSYRTPFHPEQCDLAIARGRRELERDAGDHRARVLLGEGWLCRGLQDDPWALEDAIAALRLATVDGPNEVFAQLSLADAVRKRYPLSVEAVSELQRAQRLLEQTDVGAARVDLATYISENLAAVLSARARVLPAIDSGRAALTAGRLATSELVTLAQQLVLTGSDGAREAEQIIASDAVPALQRAEILRGRVRIATARVLYAEAAAALCGTSPMGSDCPLAQQRLDQLSKMETRDAGLLAAASSSKRSEP